MDQVNTQISNQQNTSTEKPQTPISPLPSTAQKKSANGYFTRLFSGRTNRRNYFWGTFLLACIPLLLLIIDLLPAFFIGVSTGFAHPAVSGAELSRSIQTIDKTI